MPLAVRARINRRFGTFRGSIRLLLAHVEWRTGRLRRFTSPDLSQVRRVVFVCQGNICRSPFADWCARSHGVVAASFGLATGTNQPAYSDAIETASQFGIDLSNHRTTDISDFKFERGDLILAMEIRQARRLALLLAGKPMQIGLLGLWSDPPRPHIHDPHGLSRDYFDTCFRAISSGVARLAACLEKARAPAVVASERSEDRAFVEARATPTSSDESANQ